jgi:hypothetical protein
MKTAGLFEDLKKKMETRFGEGCLNHRDDDGDVAFVMEALQAAGITTEDFLKAARAEGFDHFRLQKSMQGFGQCMNLSQFLRISRGLIL